MPAPLYVVRRSVPSLALAFGVALAGCGSDPTTPPPAPAPARGVAVAPPSPVTPPAVTTRLYAPDVPLATLPLSIDIETVGGISSPMLARGTPLPASHVEVFSTASDDQPSVEIHIVQGERALAADNRELGKMQLIGIPPALRGIPQIQVTFAIDRHGVLAVTAVDLATKRTREVRIEGGLAELDAHAIDQVLADAEAHRATDAQRRGLATAQLDLKTLLDASRRTFDTPGAAVPDSLRARWAHAVARATDALAVATDVATIGAASQELRAVTHDLAALLYANAAPLPR